MKPLWIVMAMAIAAGTSCKKDKNNEFSVNKTEVGISGLLHGEASIEVTTTTAWKITAEGNPDWLQIEPSGGTGNATIILKNKVHNISDPAEVTLTLTGEGHSPVTIKLTRKPLFYKPRMKTLGGSNSDQINGGVATSDGGFILVGYSESSDGDFSDHTAQNQGIDGIAVKYSASGIVEWKKYYGGNGRDQLYSVIVTEDGGYLMAGNSTSNDGDFSSQHGEDDYWVVKTDKSGNKQWSKVYGSGMNNQAFNCVAVSGGYIIAGISQGQSGDVSKNYGNTDAWIIRLNSDGGLVWEKSFGGAAFDGARSLARTPDGHIVLAGFYESSDGTGAEVPLGSLDGWLMKFKADGEKIWSKRYGGSVVDAFYSVYATENGELTATGLSTSNDGQVSGNEGGEDALVVKTAADGQLQWAKLFGGSQNDRLQAAVPFTDKGTVVAGYTLSDELPGYKKRSDAMIAWLDSNGKLVHMKLLGNSEDDIAFLVLKTTGDRYVVGGTFHHGTGDFPSNRGSNDCWVVDFE